SLRTSDRGRRRVFPLPLVRGNAHHPQWIDVDGSGVVAQLLQYAHPVRDAPVLDHLPVDEPGDVDDIDADRLAGWRAAELAGAVVGTAGPDAHPHPVPGVGRVLDGVMQVRDA